HDRGARRVPHFMDTTTHTHIHTHIHTNTHAHTHTYIRARILISKMARGTKRSSDTPNPQAKRTRKANTAPEVPSSPLRPIPSSKDRQSLSTSNFKPINGLHFERSIASLPNTLFDLFQLFCPLNLVQQWVKYTNERPFWVTKEGNQAHHAQGPSRQYSRQNAWKPTTISEIYIFFGILIYMSAHEEAYIPDYWSLSNPPHDISRFMSRNRFMLLYRRFSMWDRTTDEISTFERIDPWSTHIQRISMQLWKPGSRVAIDEAMVKFTGRSTDTVNLPSKPIPIGYKIWVLADHGYFLRWSFHQKGQGPVNLNLKEYPNLAPTQAVVAHLLNQLPPPPTPQHGYHCFMDNLFSTPELFELLRTKNIAATGTARIQRVSSKQLAAIKVSESKKDSIPWGTIYARKHTSAEVMQFGFKDNAFVLALSTAYTGYEEPVLKERRRPSKTSSNAKTARVPFAGQATKELEIPYFINAYNNNMNG